MENLNKIPKFMLGDDVQQEFTNTAAQLATLDQVKADQSFVDLQFANIVSGAPKGTYTTLSALQTAYPTGTSGVFLVLSNGHWYYWDGATWKDGGVYQSTGIADKSIKPKNTSFLNVFANLFNKKEVKQGYYWNYNTTTAAFEEKTNASFADYKLEIEPNKTYIVTGTSFYYYLSDENDNNYLVRGSSSSSDVASVVISTPANAKYLRLSFKTSVYPIDNYMIVEGNTLPSTYVEYGYEFDEYAKLSNKQIQQIKNSLPDGDDSTKVNIIIVKKDGTGDFISLVEAVNSISDSSESNQYEIHVYDGIYDIVSELGTAYLNSITSETPSDSCGLYLPDYVDLIGYGNVELKGELPDTTKAVLSEKLSTLAINRTNKLENLTVTAKNMRYAIHDEAAQIYSDFKRKIKKCVVIHYGNASGLWSSTKAYAAGTGSGAEYEIEGNKFITYSDKNAFSMHDNSGFTVSNKILIESNEFITMIPKTCLKFGTVGSGFNHQVIMNNNKFNCDISMAEESDFAVDRGSSFKVTGSGNTKVNHDCTNNTTGAMSVEYFRFADEVAYMKNGSSSAIPKGTPVKLLNKLIYPIANGEEYLFYGIALEDIAVESFGNVKYDGFIHSNMINLTFVAGNKIGIVNGILAVVTTGEYIGIANSNTSIQLV